MKKKLTTVSFKGTPEMEVDFRKQNKLRTTAQFYLSGHPTKLQPRFDVIEIYAPYGVDTRSPRITRIENAF